MSRLSYRYYSTHVYIADLKNKKASLETSVQRAQRDVEKLAEPQVALLGPVLKYQFSLFTFIDSFYCWVVESIQLSGKCFCWQLWFVLQIDSITREVARETSRGFGSTQEPIGGRQEDWNSDLHFRSAAWCCTQRKSQVRELSLLGRLVWQQQISYFCGGKVS